MCVFPNGFFLSRDMEDARKYSNPQRKVQFYRKDKKLFFYKNNYTIVYSGFEKRCQKNDGFIDFWIKG